MVGVFDPGKMFRPVGGVLGCHTAQGGLHVLIGPLSLSTGLQVVESLPDPGNKLRASVRNDVHRNYMDTLNRRDPEGEPQLE